MNFENRELVEEYLEEYQKSPKSIDPSWKPIFESKDTFVPESTSQLTTEIELFRQHGYKVAAIYPQGIKHPPGCSDLPTGNERLKKIYCGSIGYEFAPFCDKSLQTWLTLQIEGQNGDIRLSSEKQQKILHLLNKAESFETFLHTKYVGQKRFSLEGAETLIPMLAVLLSSAAKEIVLGMPHRGRLNVLANILNKTYKEIFSEFEDVSPDTFESSGDVKYHKGYVSTVHNKNIYLAANPSHLESVDAVVEGIARARAKGSDPRLVIPVLVHGDAAIAGQGVVYETLQLSKLEGYLTGGTIHIVINNHIGFTTLPEDSRSTPYCTDIAKAFSCPIFHVNAEDPDACVFAMELALEIRALFGIDVFIDLNCWRKYGHNESDEPAFTQPLIYQVIRQKPSIRSLYHDKLVGQKVEVELLDQEFKDELQKIHLEVKAHAEKVKQELPTRMIKNHHNLFVPRETGVEASRLQAIAKELTNIPPGFTLHPRLKSQIETRASLLKGNFSECPIDWAFAESLALAALLQEGAFIRLAGQDSRRGTFSHRHGMWVDQKTADRYYPFQKISHNFELIDSSLSEYASLGFEYGYSLGNPDALVLWEAQFGDFANGAQVVIDQYIASGEQKWGVHSKLTLLLPHGYEGQGPEHSSARIERFLTLCAEDNMFVVNPTTPVQYFHLLRRQHQMNKPLIVFTPKGLLRHPKCQSTMKELMQGSFQEIIDDIKAPNAVKRVIFCQGRIYYDLEPLADQETAIVRIEQLYPLHVGKLEEIIANYNKAENYLWVQEEPYNMGAYHKLRESIQPLLPKNKDLEYRGRSASSSPACGSHLVHEQEHKLIIESLFRGKLP